MDRMPLVPPWFFIRTRRRAQDLPGPHGKIDFHSIKTNIYEAYTARAWDPRVPNSSPISPGEASLAGPPTKHLFPARARVERQARNLLQPFPSLTVPERECERVVLIPR